MGWGLRFAVAAAALLTVVGCSEDRQPSLSAFCDTYGRMDGVMASRIGDINPQATRTLAADLRRYAPEEVFDEVAAVTDMLGEFADLVEEYAQAVDDGDRDAAGEVRGRLAEHSDAADAEIGAEFDRMYDYAQAAC